VGIRDTMNKKPALTSGIVIAIIVLALAAIVYELSPKKSVKFTAGYYFSDDDGKTFYEDAMSNLPPYQHDGKEAVIAHVYQIDSNPPFVAYLQKLTPDMQKLLTTPGAPDVDPETGTLLKRPGDTDWVLMDSREGRDIRANIKPPAGESGTPLQIIPGVTPPGQ